MLSSLRQWRTDHDLTLEEISDLTGLSVPMLSRVERGKRRLAPLRRVAVARRLGVSWISLSRWENGRTRPKSPAHVRALVAMLNEAAESGTMATEAAPF